MPTNEEGEFELILGNKQLLSVFFIVVLLLGVFFTMGYIVGRNTVPGGTQVASAKGTQPPLVVDPAGASNPAAQPPEGERPSPSGGAVEPPKPEPPAQTATPPPQPPTPEPPKTEPPKSEPLKPAASKPEPAKPEPPKPASAVKPIAPKSGAPGPGRYLQVAATRQAEAELLAEVLSKKGYQTVVTPVPESALARVLVGPVREADYQAVRTELEAAGFKPFPRSF